MPIGVRPTALISNMTQVIARKKDPTTTRLLPKTTLIDQKHTVGLNGYCLDIELIGLEKSFPQLYVDLLDCVFVLG